MIQETYNGRKLKVVKGGEGGTGLTGSINGQPMPARYGVPQREVIEDLRRDIDFVDQSPIDGGRWRPYMYAPGTYELCEEGLHPKVMGEPCLHKLRQADPRCAGRDGHRESPRPFPGGRRPSCVRKACRRGSAAQVPPRLAARRGAWRGPRGRGAPDAPTSDVLVCRCRCCTRNL